jgi:hypothetical protein
MPLELSLLPSAIRHRGHGTFARAPAPRDSPRVPSPLQHPLARGAIGAAPTPPQPRTQLYNYEPAPGASIAPNERLPRPGARTGALATAARGPLARGKGF